MGLPIRWLLYVEDNEDDVALVREALAPADLPLTWAPSAAAARKQLETMQFDLMLLDHGLPDTNSLAFLDEVVRAYPRLPVVVLTGRDDDSLAVSSLRKGAAGYILKDQVTTLLLPAIEEILAGRETEDVPAVEASGRYRALVAEKADRLYRIVLETMNEGLLVVDADGIVTFANGPAGRMLARPATDLLGRAAAELFDPATRKELLAFQRSIQESPEVRSTQLEGVLLDPARPEGRPVFVSGRSVHNELGRYESCLLVLADVSELIEARNALRARLAELERFQRFLVDREHRVIELKARLRDYERRLGLESPGLSEETRRELERRLQARGLEA